MSQTHSFSPPPGDIIWLQPLLPLMQLTAVASCLMGVGGVSWVIQSSLHSDASEVLGNTDSNLWKHCMCWYLPIAFNPSCLRTAQNVCSCPYWTSSEPLPGVQTAWPFHTCNPQQALLSIGFPSQVYPARFQPPTKKSPTPLQTPLQGQSGAWALPLHLQPPLATSQSFLCGCLHSAHASELSLIYSSRVQRVCPTEGTEESSTKLTRGRKLEVRHFVKRVWVHIFLPSLQILFKGNRSWHTLSSGTITHSHPRYWQIAQIPWE